MYDLYTLNELLWPKKRCFNFASYTQTPTAQPYIRNCSQWRKYEILSMCVIYATVRSAVDILTFLESVVALTVAIAAIWFDDDSYNFIDWNVLKLETIAIVAIKYENYYVISAVVKLSHEL